MTDKEITREHNPINRIEVFKKRTDDFFATYENSSGSEDGLEICLIRDGCRAVSQAEEIINRLQAEKDGLQKIVNLSIDTQNDLTDKLLQAEENLKTAKAEAYKEFAERLKAVYEGFDDKNEVILYSNLLTAIDCLLIGMVGEK